MTKARQAEIEVYASQVAPAREADFLNYAISTTFKAGALVSHPRFGRGVVVGEPQERKIEILFEDGARMLVHATR